MSDESEVGYEKLAEHTALPVGLGKTRHIHTGPNGGVAIVDGDGGSSPAQRLGVTAAASGLYAGDDEYTYLGNVGSGPETCHGIHDIRHVLEVEKEFRSALRLREKEALLTAECLQTQGRLLTNLEAQVKFLLAKVACVEPELLGLRTNIANMEHRCTCKEAQG